MIAPSQAQEPLIRLDRVSKRFDRVEAVSSVSAAIAGGRVTGLVGPDGAGKTTLIRLAVGLLLPDEGAISVCGVDTRSAGAELREAVSYMPQRFGLYEDLTVAENLALYADLRDVTGAERRRAFERLLAFTGLGPFTARLAGRLSGGMKQKLGLACALIRRPRILLLDEPSVGVDPISRRELWRMVYDLVDEGIAVVWSTAYLDEAERCGHVIVLNAGRVLYEGPPKELTARVEGRSVRLTAPGLDRRAVLAQALRRDDVVDGVIQGRSVRLVLAPDTEAAPLGAAIEAPGLSVVPVAPRFEDAFVALLAGDRRRAPPRVASAPDGGPLGAEPAVEAHELTKRFGSFVAADRISFSIRRGEIFGLLGPNGAGKSTTFKMMCGLLRPSSGSARVAGLDLYGSAGEARARIGYMAQKFSLYGDLSVRQNLEFFAGAYGLSGARRRDAIARMIETFALGPHADSDAGLLPLGFKQRLALAAALMHEPAVLFLDEPTSGVDPLTRREFWAHINAAVGRGVTVMVTTHFMEEAEYCDRVALVHQGEIIAEGSPDDLKDRARTAARPDPTLEDAFIALVEARAPERAA